MHETPSDATAERRHAVAAIIVRGAHALFVRRSRSARAAAGYWTPVSGGIEAGEGEREALAREVREEVALEVAAERRVATIPTHDERYWLHFWTCRILAGEPRIASDEVDAVRWYAREELATLSPVFDEDVRIVLDVLRGRADEP